MKYLIKIKELAIEYWEIFVAFLFLLIGVVWGTSGSREKVLKDDARAKEKARIKQQKETVNAVAKNQEAVNNAEKDRSKSEKLADEKMIKRKKELLKNPDKLDNILKEEYDLEGE